MREKESKRKTTSRVIATVAGAAVAVACAAFGVVASGVLDSHDGAQKQYAVDSVYNLQVMDRAASDAAFVEEAGQDQSALVVTDEESGESYASGVLLVTLDSETSQESL